MIATAGRPSDPAPDASLAQLLRQRSALTGAEQIVAAPDGAVTLQELIERARGLAAGLAARGIAERSVVATYCPNTLGLIETWFASMLLGAVFMPINQLITGPALRSMLAVSRSAAVVCSASHVPDLVSLVDSLPSLRALLTSDAHASYAGIDTVAHVSARFRGGRVPEPVADQELPAKLMFTSGTTGRPKGAIWSRRCEAVWATAYARELVTLRPGEVAYSCLPLAHVTCQGTVIAALLNGGSVTVDAAFEPFRFWSRIRETDARIFSFVGTLLTTLARRRRHNRDADNPVRRAVGAATPAALWREIEERFTFEIVETWGQTETASCWFAPRSTPSCPGTIGVPSERCEIRVVGADGGPASDGEPGELWLRPRKPHHMFDGYLGDECNAPWNADGWYRSGDLIVRDDAETYRFVARVRDAIRRHGETIAPSLIEDVAIEHAQVSEAAAVAVPDARSPGEDLIKLCVVAREHSVLDTASVERFLRSRLPRLLWPSRIVVYAELPKTATTRVERWRLAADG